MKVRPTFFKSLPGRATSQFLPYSQAFPASSLTPPSLPTSTEPANPRWLSDTKARIGKCIMFGTDQAQTRKAGEVLGILGAEWRDFVAGREGFLVDKKRAGFLRHKVVWGEMDSMSHINNVTYTRYAESARVNWAYNYAVHVDPQNSEKWHELCTPKGNGLILRSIRTDYKFPMTWPDRISVFHKLHAKPDPTDSHFILDVMILSEKHQRPAARCTEDIVVYDYKKGVKVNILPFMMAAFDKTWSEQKAAKDAAIERIREVEQSVRELELSTWDREGAVEDMGPTA